MPPPAPTESNQQDTLSSSLPPPPAHNLQHRHNDNDDEWTNIQDVVKTTFRAMHQVIVEQQSSISSLQQQLEQLQLQMHEQEKSQESRLADSITALEDRLSEQLNLHKSQISQLSNSQDSIKGHMEQKLDLSDFESRSTQLEEKISHSTEQLSDQSSQALSRLSAEFETKLNTLQTDVTDKMSADLTVRLDDLESTVETRISSLHSLLRSKPSMDFIERHIKDQHLDSLKEEFAIENNSIREETKTRLDLLSRSIETIVKECNSNSDQVNSLKDQIYEQDKKHQLQKGSFKMDLDKYVQHVQDLAKQQLESQLAQKDHSWQLQLSDLKQSLQNEISTTCSTSVNELSDDISQRQKALKKDLLNRLSSQLSDAKKEFEDKNTTQWKELDILKARLNDEISDLRSFFIGKSDEWKELFSHKSDLKQIKSYLHERLNESLDQVHSQWKSKLQDQVNHLQQRIEDRSDSVLSRIQQDLNETYVEKTDHENVVRTLQESLRTSFDLHQQEKRARLNMQTETDSKIADYTEKLKFLISQIEKSVKHDDFQMALNKKADLRTMNQWVQQHTQDVNEVLDMKANLDDLLSVKEELKKKVDEKLIQELRNEIYELSDMRNRLSTITNQISTDYVDKRAQREAILDVLNQVDKRISEQTSSLSQQLRDVNHTLSDKVDRSEYERQLRGINDKKVSREELIPLREEMMPSREAIANCVSQTDFKLFTNTIQQELKSLSKTKLDAADYNYLMQTVKNFITRKDVDSIMDTKVSSLRKSIDTLHRSIGQLLVSSNSSTQRGEPKLPKTPHVRHGVLSGSTSKGM